MGLLVEGKWQDQWYDTEATGGRFQRDLSRFRSWVTVDGSAGPSGSDGFKAEPNRYHLYVSLACPWAHRTLIFRKLKGLEDMISVSAVHPLMHENGWTFQDGPGVIADPIFNADYMYQIYTAAQSDYTGRVTVPVLWDKKNNTIVSNESSEIIRMFNSAFDEVGANKDVNFLPEDLRGKIDELNDFIYPNINNGVYKSGFATTQEAYDEAVVDLFKALDTIEARLENNRYLTGDSITEADWRLFTTLIRFDPVYVGHFKCNIRRIVDYPNLWGYTRDLYQVPGVAETVNMDHIKSHYYGSHDTINPTLIVPRGPDIDFMSAHGREKLAK
ncbi:glutathione S-transferase family protein [Psychrobacter sanguinis]|uniref:glutathione S-transferase family protein n=1 Tax=Psychrobacter sanguinis TaxID=861445 RepID=UPI00191916D8|nr:glutathione S-transferase family protein [Psychrobacter sanguinis]MCC3307642.1 glutathione S-transferase family protein [Psychrobacter sanguinis]UEC24969.1 glutathione S-transferase family protein [Psychrobacter sanguinis]